MPERRTDLFDLNTPPSPQDRPPDFDINHYLEMAKDFEMSEEEKTELLIILWDIMRRFVELGWGVDSISLLGEQSDEIARNKKGSEV